MPGGGSFADLSPMVRVGAGAGGVIVLLKINVSRPPSFLALQNDTEYCFLLAYPHARLSTPPTCASRRPSLCTSLLRSFFLRARLALTSRDLPSCSALP